VPHVTLELTTTSVAGTRAVGAALAHRLRAGDVVTLSGELGAGKTALVQGAAAALGVTLPVTSPTFVLVKHLPAPVPVVHVDVYRLEWLAHVDDLDEDVFAPDVVTFVEWADRIAHLLPDDRLEVHLDHVDHPDHTDHVDHPDHLGDPDPGAGVEVVDGEPDDADRRLRVVLRGGWVARLEALEHDLAGWLGDRATPG
jgi:tRNA threonylcarbamoyladenosine biosynthesis protein TsaE